ncbi:hypothetical protein FRC02_001868 [Tulasnella sp. 418]|nr:hypothetical protein FRC02_001868 [Tulasnella sp. 418]
MSPTVIITENHETIRQELEEEERLDEIDPLRHLRGSSATDDSEFIPTQKPSVINQIINRTFADIEIKLVVDAGPGCGGIAWPAGEVLSNYLCTHGRNLVKGKRCLELGSGTGLVSLVAAKLGSKVSIATDQSPLLDLIRHNVEINDLGHFVQVSELNWGEPLIPMCSSNLDLVLAADCVYFEPAFPLLVQTLKDLNTTNPNAIILFCYKKRRKADKKFFVLLRKHFDWQNVQDAQDRVSYEREGISLFKLIRRSISI